METIFDKEKISLERQQEIFDNLNMMPEEMLNTPNKNKLMESIIKYCCLNSIEIRVMDQIVNSCLLEYKQNLNLVNKMNVCLQ